MLTYDKLYIDGSWVAPAGTDTLEVIDSTTEEVFATIPAGVPADIDRAVAAAKAAFASVVGGTGPRARQAAPPGGRRARGPSRRDRGRDHARGRHAQGSVRRDPGGHGNLGLLGGFRARVHVRVRGHEQRSYRRPRAHRRRRLHHAVELPAQPDRRQGRVRAGRRLHRRAEAVGGRTGQRVHPRRDHRRHRLPARCVQPGDRRRSRRRRGAGRAPGRRHDLVHRLDPRRTPGLRARVTVDQEGRARARRQVAERAPRRRRLRSLPSRRASAPPTPTRARPAARSPA